MPAIQHGRIVAPGFPSASGDGSFLNPSFQPIDPPVFDQGRQFAETFLDLHRSGRLSGLPAGEFHPEASRRSANTSDFGVSTEPNPGEGLLRMEAARKRLAPTSTQSEFAMRANADGGVGASADSSVGEFLIRLGRAREQAAAGEDAGAGAFTMHADGEARVGAGPELGLALLRFAASADRFAPTDRRKPSSISSPAEFAMRASADGGVGVDPGIGAALLRLHGSDQQAGRAIGAANPVSSVLIGDDEDAGVSIGPPRPNHFPFQTLQSTFASPEQAAPTAVSAGVPGDPKDEFAVRSRQEILRANDRHSVPNTPTQLSATGRTTIPNGTLFQYDLLHLDPNANPSGVKNYQPPLRDRVAAYIAKHILGGESRKAFREARQLVEVGESILPPLEIALAAHNAGRSAASGDLPGSALAILIGPGKIFSKMGRRFKRSSSWDKLDDGTQMETVNYRSKFRSGKLFRPDRLNTEFKVVRPSDNAGNMFSFVKFYVNDKLVPDPEKKPKEWRRMVGTVQNNFADFTIRELAKREAFSIEFEGATDKMSDFYLALKPKLERAYGVTVQTQLVENRGRIVRKFKMNFKRGHTLPGD